MLLCILLCIGVTTEKVFSRGADLKILVYDDGRIDLYAVNVKFTDLLDAISLKTGIEFSTEMKLSDYIDCDFEKKKLKRQYEI